MNPPDVRLVSDDQTAARGRRSVVVTSYRTGATQGQRLGSPGYSYDLVAALFRPLLERWGEVHMAGRDELPQAVSRLQAQAKQPVHISFLPFQDAPVAAAIPNVIVPAWEFPDVPDQVFDGNPHNDWRQAARGFTAVMVGGPFTVQTLRRGGVELPIHVVPVPVPDAYFDLPDWTPQPQAVLQRSVFCLPQDSAAGGYELPCTLTADAPPPPAAAGGPPRQALPRGWGVRAYRRLVKPCLPRRFEAVFRAAARAGLTAWQEQSTAFRRTVGTRLGDVVYTSIFNPDDGRKNWEDLLTGFLAALGDRPDATLVLKLISDRPAGAHRILAFYRRLRVAHRCRIVIDANYLSPDDMLQLARASTYYVTTSRAEGNCLPLMNYLAAGRPGVCPAHTALGDYFDEALGFVIAAHAEPAYWPHDSRRCWRTTWQRLVWTSLVEQLRRSYETARHDKAAYARLAAAARQRMAAWAGGAQVALKLTAALDEIAGQNACSPRPAQQGRLWAVAS